MNKNICLIFARGGSKGLKNKNIKNFNKKPLIYYTIKFALNSKLIHEIYVSTDSKKIQNYCKKLNVKIIDRPAYLAKDTSKEILSWKHAINILNKKKIDIKNIIILPVTSPLRNDEDIKKALKLANSCDIVLSATNSSRSPYFNMLKKTLNGYKLFIHNNKFFRRQDVPQTYDVSTNFYVTNSNFINKTKHIYDGKIKIVEIPKERSIDIDDKYDFELAEFFYKKNKKKFNF
tara:strand:+ start:10283 stop:10978 length:696 start_codon:yes stop_codon:yes gene_type:complete